MISTQKKFLFVHIPKTGGNSIQSVLLEYSSDDLVCLTKEQDGVERFEIRNKKYAIKKHSTLAQYKGQIEGSLYESLYKVATIRNPWDKMISFYFSPHSGRTEWDRDEFINLISRIPLLRHYIYVPNLLDRVARKLRISNSIGRATRDIDFLLRFENLQTDFDEFCRQVGIPRCGLPIRNKSSRTHYSKYYDEELIDLVGKRFSEEIGLGNYSFEKSA